MNAAEIIANQQKNGNSNQSGKKGKSSYLTLESGKPVTFRMLSTFSPKYVASHACGLSHVEIDKAKFDLAMQNGQPYPCPQCGQPITINDIEMERPVIEGAYMHRFVPTATPGKSMNVACIGDMQNAQWGIVETNPDGTPKYHCPVCDERDEKGQPKHKKQPRLYGLAVERTPHIEMKNIGGINQPVMTGCEDVMVTEEDGTVHPKVLIIDLPFKSFWSVLMGLSPAPDYELSVCYFDWQVTRTGEGLSTKYDVQRLNPNQPSTVDPRPYQEWSTDIHDMLQFWGSAKKYTDGGWAIAGYVPPANEQMQPQQMAPQMPVQQYVQPPVSYGASYAPAQQAYAPQPTVNVPTTSWAAIQQQIG